MIIKPNISITSNCNLYKNLAGSKCNFIDSKQNMNNEVKLVKGEKVIRCYIKQFLSINCFKIPNCADTEYLARCPAIHITTACTGEVLSRCTQYQEDQCHNFSTRKQQ